MIIFVSSGGFFIGNLFDNNDETKSTSKPELTVYESENYSIEYPQDYQFSEDKIISTQDFTENQENTIHLISPLLPNSDGNLSIIITFEPLNDFEEEASRGSTCAELFQKKLDPIEIGTHTFTHSGLINCGPNEVAFFYVINNGNIYEAKVETSADYELDAYPQVIKILETMKFKSE